MDRQMTNDDHELLIKIDTKLDIALSRVDDHEARLRVAERSIGDLTGKSVSLENDSKDHELRTRKVEKMLWVMVAVSAVGGGAIGNLAVSLFNGSMH